MELLIVVLIIGVVYTIAIGNFESLKTDRLKPNLLNLKSHLYSLPHANKVKLMCLDRCKNCFVYIDEELNNEFSSEFDNFLDSSVKAYRFDTNLGLMEIKKEIFFNSQDNEEEICFSYEIDKKGIGNQVLVEYKGYVYDFTQHFTNTVRYPSLGDATAAKEDQLQKVLR